MKNIVLFSLTANPKLTKEIAGILGIEEGKAEVKHFADGEIMARPLESVRGKDIYIIQSTSYPSSDRIMELLIFMDALSNAAAKDINLVIPYFGYCRQDRIARYNEPISARMVAKLFSYMGVTRVITLDLHTPQVAGFFGCPVDALTSIPLFGSYYQKKLKELKIKGKDVVIVSPDHGSAHRARDLATLIPDSTIAIIDKRRPEPNLAEVTNIIGEVNGKICIIVDDIVDTAGTVIASTKKLFEVGAKGVLIGATHGVFSKDALKKLNSLKLLDLVTTNSIEISSNGLNVISIGPMIAEVIKDTEEGLPINEDYLSYY